MALKKTRQEVKHLMLSGDFEYLNKQIAEFVNDGWRVATVRDAYMDYNNRHFTFIYVLIRDNDAE